MAEDQVELGVAAALVRPEHDGVRGLVCQLTQVEVLGAGEQLDITATAVEPVLESHLVLKDQLLLLPEGEGSLQLGRHSAENILWLKDDRQAASNELTCVLLSTSSPSQSRQRVHPRLNYII